MLRNHRAVGTEAPYTGGWGTGAPFTGSLRNEHNPDHRPARRAARAKHAAPGRADVEGRTNYATDVGEAEVFRAGAHQPRRPDRLGTRLGARSEEHTSELQSRPHLV